MKELIGHTVTGIRLSYDGKVLAFDTDDGVYAYEAMGSHDAHFSEFMCVTHLKGQKVISVEEKPYRINTEKGTFWLYVDLFREVTKMIGLEDVLNFSGEKEYIKRYMGDTGKCCLPINRGRKSWIMDP